MRASDDGGASSFTRSYSLCRIARCEEQILLSGTARVSWNGASMPYQKNEWGL